MTGNERRGRLAQLLRDKALRRGEFTLASGRRSSYYLDARLLTLHPEGSCLIAQSILELLEREEIQADAIGGLTLGADPIAGAVAAVSHLEGTPLAAFIVRKQAKDHGTGRRVEGGLKENDRVVVVDDVITTAGSTLEAIRAVEELGCRVVGVVCIVDREEGGAQALSDYPFFPLFRVAELLDETAAGG